MNIRNVDTEGFAKKIGISVPLFRKMLKDGSIPPARKIGRSLFWLEPIADAWIIKAFEYPMPLPELPAEIMQEIDEAVTILREKQDVGTAQGTKFEKSLQPIE